MTQCPTTATLSLWLDDEIGHSESARIRQHVEDCVTCREQVLGWVGTVRELAERSGRVPTGDLGCGDPETVVAYAEDQLSGDALIRFETHIAACTRCVAGVQRVIQQRMAMGENLPPTRDAADVAVSVAAPALESVWAAAARWIGARRPTSFGAWRMLSAAAATAALLLALTTVARWRQPEQFQIRGGSTAREAEVIVDTAAGRAQPGGQEQIILDLTRGMRGTVLEQREGWTRLQLKDGRRVWVSIDEIRTSEPGVP